ncbi:MAG TPA: GNAT family N-acetyltransferase [Dehalococcoidia bacterium]|nr:GNAT family N-acetyltransferase [Dehalococcoidia bacterium]
MSTSTDCGLSVRHDLRPGDLGRVTEQHGVLYAAEYSFDHTFEAYVAQSLAEFALTLPAAGSRIWLAEDNGRLVGSVGILRREHDAAQLRWFLVDPAARGQGLGQRLLDEALAFCRASEYTSVYLWTVSLLTAAGRRYRAAGFRKTEEQTHALWGTVVTEERYDLALDPPGPGGSLEPDVV